MWGNRRQLMFCFFQDNHMTLDESEEDDTDDKGLFSRYLVCAYSASGIVSDSGDALVSKTDKRCPGRASFQSISMSQEET